MLVFKQTKGAHPSTQSHVFFFCTWWLWVVLSSDICQRGWKQNMETSQIHVNYRSITIIVVKMGATFKQKLKCALLMFFTFGKHHVKWNRSLQWPSLLKTCVLKQKEQSEHSKKYCRNLVHANLDIKYLSLTRHHFPQVKFVCKNLDEPKTNEVEEFFLPWSLLQNTLSGVAPVSRVDVALSRFGEIHPGWGWGWDRWMALIPPQKREWNNPS